MYAYKMHCVLQQGTLQGYTGQSLKPPVIVAQLCPQTSMARTIQCYDRT